MQQLVEAYVVDLEPRSSACGAHHFEHQRPKRRGKRITGARAVTVHQDPERTFTAAKKKVLFLTTGPPSVAP